MALSSIGQGGLDSRDGNRQAGRYALQRGNQSVCRTDQSRGRSRRNHYHRIRRSTEGRPAAGRSRRAVRRAGGEAARIERQYAVTAAIYRGGRESAGAERGGLAGRNYQAETRRGSLG